MNVRRQILAMELSFARDTLSNLDEWWSGPTRQRRALPDDVEELRSAAESVHKAAMYAWQTNLGGTLPRDLHSSANDLYRLADRSAWLVHVQDVYRDDDWSTALDDDLVTIGRAIDVILGKK